MRKSQRNTNVHMVERLHRDMLDVNKVVGYLTRFQIRLYILSFDILFLCYIFLINFHYLIIIHAIDILFLVLPSF